MSVHTSGNSFKPYYSDPWATIYHGDARDILPQLDWCDLVLTDPPYGVGYYDHRLSRREAPRISGDSVRVSLALYRQVLPLLKAEHLLWFTRWDVWPDVWPIVGQWFHMRGLLVWDKGTPGRGDLNHWGVSYELIASAGQGRISGSRDGSILRFRSVPSRQRLHISEKPVPLLAYLITKMGAHCTLDPFMGSGSTLSAARAVGKHAIGIEVDERYCEIAAKRLTQEVLPLEVS